jgi:hypothetical protein
VGSRGAVSEALVYSIANDSAYALTVFQTLTTSYAAEVAPVALRGYLTTWVSYSSLMAEAPATAMITY